MKKKLHFREKKAGRGINRIEDPAKQNMLKITLPTDY